MSESNITAANWGLVFYGPSPTITLTITAGATAYSITDIFSNVVSSGTISASVTSFTATVPSGGWINGWYLVQLSGPSSYYAIGTFNIVNADGRFKTVPAWGASTFAANPQFLNDDYPGLWTSCMGAYRWELASITSPSTDIAAIQANLAFIANWTTSDPVRQPTFFVSFGNVGGGYDTVTIGNIKFYRRGTQTDPATITIGTGTVGGYKLTVTDTNTSTVVETHDNMASAVAIQAAVNAQAGGWLLAYGATSSAPTQTTASLPNTNTLGAITVIQAVYNYNSVGIKWFEGPENEPGSGDPGGFAAFVTVVHAAESGAKAFGPSYLGAQGGNMTTWAANVQSIGVTPDGVSFHPYNMSDLADLVAEDQTFPTVTSPIKAAWGSNLPIFCTEFEIFSGEFATYHPLSAAAQMVGVLAYSEVAGIPKERYFYFYATSHGYGAQPSWWKNGDNTLNPHWMAARGVSERLYGTTFSSRITLPFPLNQMFLAAKWTDSTNQTILIQSSGAPSASVNLSVTGISSLNIYDWAGNQSTVAVTEGLATVIVSELGTWIVTPLATTINISDINDGLMYLGTNQADFRATDMAITTSSTVGKDQTNTIWLNGSDPETADRTGIGQVPWRDSSDTLPSTLTFTPMTPVRVDRAIILCPPSISDGQRNSLIQFEIQYQAPGSSSWTTCYTETNTTATSSAMVGTWSNVGSTAAWSRLSAWDTKYQFDCVFSDGPVVGKAFRVVAQTTSYGQVPDLISQQADNVLSSQNEVQYFECRFIGLYCTAAQTSPSVLV